MDNNNESNLDFQLDLLPVISLLAVLISFLLITAVWIQLGSSDISQALGSEGNESNASYVEARMQKDGTLKIFVMKNSKVLNSSTVTTKNLTRRANTLKKHVQYFKSKYPNIKSGIVLPSANTSLDEVVRTLDAFRSIELTDVGVAPLGT